MLPGIYLRKKAKRRPAITPTWPSQKINIHCNEARAQVVHLHTELGKLVVQIDNDRHGSVFPLGGVCSILSEETV